MKDKGMKTLPGTSTKSSCRYSLFLALQNRKRATTMRSPIIPPTVPSITLTFEPWETPV